MVEYGKEITRNQVMDHDTGVACYEQPHAA
jgi:hypothetical protein